MLKRRAVVPLALLLLVSAFAPSARAAQVVWSGSAGTAFWSNPNNWIGNAIPVSNDGVSFIGGARITTCDIAAKINNITFGSSATGSIISGTINMTGTGATFNIQDDGSSEIDAAIVTSGTSTLYIKNSTAGQKTTFKGVISGDNGLRIYGPGVIEFSGGTNNSYTGATLIGSSDPSTDPVRIAGILRLNSGSAGSLIPGNLTIGGTVSGQAANSAQVILAVSQCISDDSNVSIASDGVLNMNGLNETVASLSGTGNVSMGTGSLAVSGAVTTTFSGSISGTGGFTRSGTGVQTFSGVNTYTGLTSVVSGTLILNSPGTGGACAGSVSVGDGIGSANTAVLQYSANQQIANAPQITVRIDGRLNFNNFSDTVGAVAITGGNITLGTGVVATGAINMTGGAIAGTTPGQLSLSGSITATSSVTNGACVISAPMALNGTRTFTVNAGTMQPELTVSGSISDGSLSSGFVKSGTGTMLLNNPAINSYTAPSLVDKGVVTLNSAARAIVAPLTIGNTTDPAGSATVKELNNFDFANNLDVTVNPSGVLDLNGFSEQLGAVSGSGGLKVNSPGILGVGGLSSSSKFDGLISGTGGVTKSGTGAIIFTAANTYIGVTTISNGTLAIDGAQTGAVTVSNTGTLGGSGTVGAVTVNGGALSPGDPGNGVGTLTTGALTMAANSSLILDVPSSSPGGFDQLNVVGAATLAGTISFNATYTPAPTGTKLILVKNDGADALTGTFTNLTTTASIAGVPYLVSYTGGTGNDLELTAQNTAPQAASTAVCTPNPAGLNQIVVATVAVIDPNGDTLNFLWDFGDGTEGTGASATHKYLSIGTYNVSVAISDGMGGTAASSVSLSVVAPTYGDGFDSDSDSFSDDFEAAAGSDPLLATSTPTGTSSGTGGGAIPPTPLPAVKIAIHLNFKKPGVDTITLSGTMTIPAGFVPLGQRVAFDIGGVSHGFTLTAKGNAVDLKNTFKIGYKKPGIQKYALKLVKGSFSTALGNHGLSSVDEKKIMHTVPITMLFNSAIYQLQRPVVYTAKTGKSGAAK